MNAILIRAVKQAFIEKFRLEPVLVFSPGRINLIGEHTDYNDGFVFPAAIDKGIVAALQKSDLGHCTAVAINLDSSINFELDNIKPSKEGSWENYVLGVVAEIQNKGKLVGNFNIVFKGDIPKGAGMSSSAALENSVVFGLNELFNLGTLRDATESSLKTVLDEVTPENYQKALYVIQENIRTQKAAQAIENNDLEALGSLLYQSHEGLSKLRVLNYLNLKKIF